MCFLLILLIDLLKCLYIMHIIFTLHKCSLGPKKHSAGNLTHCNQSTDTHLARPCSQSQIYFKLVIVSRGVGLGGNGDWVYRALMCQKAHKDTKMNSCGYREGPKEDARILCYAPDCELVQNPDPHHIYPITCNSFVSNRQLKAACVNLLGCHNLCPAEAVCHCQLSIWNAGHAFMGSS